MFMIKKGGIKFVSECIVLKSVVYCFKYC